ncbi:MAG: bifunctional 5,10-methylenetetrahydrofolate dehydrogenase/5,10-methenyltetrahydrofolate cyclohydrolase [Myxococcota bacterium]
MQPQVNILNGRDLACSVRQKLAAGVAQHMHQGYRAPQLCTVLVGNDPASAIYVRNKQKQAAAIGITPKPIYLEQHTSEKQLLHCIDQLNANDAIDAILVQLPLPPQINVHAVLRHVDPHKDVDGFHPSNVGLLSMGIPRFIPCTPRACMQLLQHAKVQLTGRHAVVLGRSLIVGKPLAQLLLAQHATVTICHSRTVDLPNITRQADVLVCAMGKAQYITAAHVQPNATVIDVGINRHNGGKLVGDVDTQSVLPLVHAITPVPGGVGPMTIAMLLDNTYRAYCARMGFDNNLPAQEIAHV